MLDPNLFSKLLDYSQALSKKEKARLRDIFSKLPEENQQKMLDLLWLEIMGTERIQDEKNKEILEIISQDIYKQKRKKLMANHGNS